MRPKFISHPNGIVLRVFKWKSDKPRPSTQNLLLPPPRKPRELPPPRDCNADTAGRNKRLPSFISHPNGILLRVFKKQRSMIEKQLSGTSFICHPNGMVLKVLNQKRSRKSPFRARCGTDLRLHQSSAAAAAAAAASMVKMEMETQTNRNAEQRVKQLKRVKRRANQHHYSYAHHWPPQQQYKSKSWTIAIILKLIFVAWDSWTYRIGY